MPVMSSTPDTPGVTHERLGALVREQREGHGLSMDQLATRSRVSRSSIHRLEHGSPVKPTPSKLARVLAVVGIDAEVVRNVMPADEYREDVIHWLSKASQEELTDVLAASRSVAVPDLVAIHQDGAVARIQVSGEPERTDELAGALQRAGWLVTRPT